MDSNKKYLILYNSVPYFLPYLNRTNVVADLVLRKLSFAEKIFRKISRILGLKQYYWFGEWKNNIEQYDVAIIFATLHETDVIKLLRMHNKNIRIIYWYWNPVSGVRDIDYNKLDNAEIWSFDPKDCEKFSFHYNTTFYFNEIKLNTTEIVYDALFIGKDKGRRRQLLDLECVIKNYGLNTYFYIHPDDPKQAQNQIPYSEYLEKISKSKVLIDIVAPGQSGLTVRAMESIFLKRKLITYDHTIINNSFYTPENIFIIGKDNIKDLKGFIDKPYKELDADIVDYYSIEKWLERFNNH
jgi:hypothetical protein